MAFSQADLDAIAAAQAAHPGLPPNYLLGVAQRETGGSANPDTAASGTGPTGLFQVAPSTYQNPGFGLPTHPVSRADAIAALSDPATSANFAADYLTAVQAANAGNLDTAQRVYSGGGYGAGDVSAASNQALSQYPNYQSSNAGGGIVAPASASTSTGNSIASATGKIFSPVWEIVSRAILLFAGFALIMLAIIALLFQSKTVQVSAKALAAGAV